MLRFKTFLNESESKYTPVKSIDDEISIIKDHPSIIRAIKSGSILYRGMKGNFPKIGLLSTEGTVRQSVDTNNIYQLMMDSSKALSQFPKRTNSIICSTSIEASSVYGTRYIILPLDEAPLAVSSAPDFLNQELTIPHAGKLATTTVSRFSDYIGILLTNLNITSSPWVKQNDLKKLDAELSKIKISQAEVANNLSDGYGSDPKSAHKPDNVQFALSSILLPANKNNISLTAAASEFMTPFNLELNLIRFGNKLPQAIREVWFSGEALMLTVDSFSKTLEKLEEQGYEIDKKMYDAILSY